MPYNYIFTKELEQFGLCSFRLNLTDSDYVLPDLNIPVLFRVGEDTEEKKEEIALRMIEENTPPPPPPVVEEPVVEEPLTEEPVVEEPSI